MPQPNQNREQRPETVRGPELRKKIEESQKMGEDFRSETQGTDMIDTNVKHGDSKTKNRSSDQHNSKK